MNLHTSDMRHRASSRASRDEGGTELRRSAWPQLPCLGRGRTGDASTGPWPSWPRTRDHDMHNPGVRVSRLGCAWCPGRWCNVYGCCGRVSWFLSVCICLWFCAAPTVSTWLPTINFRLRWPITVHQVHSLWVQHVPSRTRGPGMGPGS